MRPSDYNVFLWLRLRQISLLAHAQGLKSLSFGHQAKPLLVLFSFLCSQVNAQSDSTFHLPEVQISGKTVRIQPIGLHTETLDSTTQHLYRTEHLGELLRAHGLLNIRSYGTAGLSTAGIRGGAANQTAVIWNGFSLLNQQSGLTDLSNLPSGLFDQVSLVAGSNSSLYGNSSIGGVIALQQIPNWNKGLDLKMDGSLGSFGFRQINAQVHMSRKKWSSSTRWVHQKAENNFPYKVQPGAPTLYMTNAANRSHHVMQDFAIQLKPNQRITYHFWANSGNRQIQPLITQSRSVANQSDYAVRNAIEWQYFLSKSVLEVRGGYFREGIDYTDSLSGVYSNIKSDRITAEGEYRYRFTGRWLLHSGLSINHFKARAPGYQEGVTQQKTAAFASLQYKAGRFQSQLDIREEWVSNVPNAFVPALGARYHSSNQVWVWRGRISSIFRQPTLNDLYWQPGGNPDLKPESGWSAEGGLEVRKRVQKLDIQAFTTAYFRDLRDMIYWRPVSGSPVWSPANIAQVHTHGLENRLHLAIPIRQVLHFKWILSYDYTRSSNQIAITKPAITKGEQLWYVPKHQASASCEAKYKAMSLMYRYQWVDQVTTPEGGLSAYALHSMAFNWHANRSQSKMYLFMRLDHLANKNWISIDRRVMPGLQWRVGVGFGV